MYRLKLKFANKHFQIVSSDFGMKVLISVKIDCVGLNPNDIKSFCWKIEVKVNLHTKFDTSHIKCSRTLIDRWTEVVALSLYLTVKINWYHAMHIIIHVFNDVNENPKWVACVALFFNFKSLRYHIHRFFYLVFMFKLWQFPDSTINTTDAKIGMVIQ